MDVMSSIVNFLTLVTWPLMCYNPTSLQMGTPFDFIVVGGGSAGSVVASRLSENPSIRVLLLEAGGCPPILSYIPTTTPLVLGSPSITWQYKIAPQTNSFWSYPNNQSGYAQGKVLGGTGSVNNMMYIRGSPECYDQWASMGNPGWGWQDVLPAFLLSEGNTIPSQMTDTTYHNTTGPFRVSFATPTKLLEPFLQSAQLNGYAATDLNGPNSTGAAQDPYTLIKGVRSSTFSGYILPNSNRPNLVISPNSLVTKILTDSNKRAIGVQYQLNGVTKTAYATKEVIVSAGAINSPKLLLLSGIGPAAQLQKFNISVVVNLPGVGENLQDHVGNAALLWTVNCTDCTYTFENVLSIQSIWSYLTSGTGPFSSFGGNEAVAYLKSQYAAQNGNLPDIELQLVSTNPVAYTSLFEQLTGISPQDINQFFGPLHNDTAFMIYVFNTRPKSRGTLSLQSADPTQQPNINFNFFSDDSDMKVLVDGVKQAIKIVSSEPLLKLGAKFNPTIPTKCQNMDVTSDAYYECLSRCFTYVDFNVAGTCQMGPSTNTMAVVNSTLEVYQVGGLRVVDNSIIPVLPNGNTYAIAVMIGEKGAAAIKTKYGI